MNHNRSVAFIWLTVSLLGWATLDGFDSHLPDGVAALAATPWLLWQFTPIIIIPMIYVVAWYVRGRRRSGQAIGARDASFAAAILLLFLVLQSPIEGFSDQFFTVHQVEHMTLDMIAPMLLLLAAPQAPLLRGMPEWLRHKLVPAIMGNGPVHRIFATISQPILASLLFIGTSDFWLIPRIHDASLRIPLIHDLWHITLFASGLIFFFRLLDPRPAPLGAPLLARILMCFLAEMNFILFGFYLSAKSVVLYNAYGRMAPFWHISALSDERFGGLTMWIDGSTMITLGALIALHRIASHEDRVANRQIAVVGVPLVRGSQFHVEKRRDNRNLAFGLVGFVGFMLIGTLIAAVVYDRMTNYQANSGAFSQVGARTLNGRSARAVKSTSKSPQSDKP
ncbi:cytochrome c oxidase assembly protein [Acidiphilium sp. PA]|uniref:cytochrome c oxidase assembly protein n=1 Tax=Acidiphilium sp. PA TaxID=2871705 RepID=UPI002243378A|nr:cytochrome c oxidase assembly protein [Acidiphilium sp. PA]MCW8309066.1 cytochrome c oxidase assembly protein [Acidiphilium sp. PA]